jgi:hypothetical protein
MERSDKIFLVLRGQASHPFVINRNLLCVSATVTTHAITHKHLREYFQIIEIFLKLLLRAENCPGNKK